jgi:S-DNA-T family DNA segregation ATPase FtsK/SpoIIIE
LFPADFVFYYFSPRLNMADQIKPQDSAQAIGELFDKSLESLGNLKKFSWDISGVGMIAFASMSALGLIFPEAVGGLLNSWTNFVRLWFGYGSMWVVLLFLLAGVLMLRQRDPENIRNVEWSKIFSLEVIALTSLAILAVAGGSSIERAELGLDGGRTGWGLAELLYKGISFLGFQSYFWRNLLLGLILAANVIFITGLVRPLRLWVKNGTPADSISSKPPSSNTLTANEGLLVTDGSQQKSRSMKADRTGVKLPLEFRKTFKVQTAEDQTVAEPPERDERLPQFELLAAEKAAKPNERNINMTAGLIEKTLSDFSIPVKVVGFRVGPTVTQFAVEPGYLEKEKETDEGNAERQKIRVSQIANLKRDLALALSATRLRIEAPVPGKPYIGMEVPNTNTQLVRLKPILESEAFYKLNSPLTIALGRDVSGTPLVADLGKMPHLLIAGTTGSGKSVCIASITTCLVMNNTPEELRLVMIDPKMVELVRFNGLPHLFGKVETDLKRILGVLQWTVAEMDRRYKLLEESRSRNIDTYNKKMKRSKEGEVLPKLVVMIDELADLMMSAPEQTEHNLVRLAQMARATGIHLVIATQRPSTDVVTGLIKANFPARLSFAVASAVDSRVILDNNGAESLLGQGDMLYMPPEAAAPIRSQGVMVDDVEIERIIKYWQKIHNTSDAQEAPWEKTLKEAKHLAEKDELIEKAIAIVRQTQRASASMLQRKLRVGYPRAARLVDELEQLGVVGPSVGGGKEREVLISDEPEMEEMS